MLQSAVRRNYITYQSNLQFTVGAQLVFHLKHPHSAQSQNSQNWFSVYTWAAFGMKTILTLMVVLEKRSANQSHMATTMAEF